jgi:hypothetical protein
MDLYHTKKAVPMRAFLKADTSIIGRLIQHIEFLKGLEQRLLPFLDPPLNKHCTIANYVNDTLILHTDAPVWASRIRYNTPQILLFMQNECDLATLKTIRIKAIPARFSNTRSPDNSWKLEEHTANLIRQAAAATTDEPLRQSLQKISSHFESGDGS